MPTENRRIIIWKDVTVLCVAFAAWALWSKIVFTLDPYLIRRLGTTDVAFNFLLISLIRGIGLVLIGFEITVFLNRINPWYCLAILAVLVTASVIVITPWQDVPELAAVQNVSETSLLAVTILGPALILVWFGLGIAVGRWYRRNAGRPESSPRE